MLPSYFLTLPQPRLSAADRVGVQRLCDEILHGKGQELAYELELPKWQFLCYVVETLEVVLHGSGDSGISDFQPRKSDDVDEFGNRQAVYAASDGVWPIYFAIVDRQQVRSLLNACLRIVDEVGSRSEPYYFFSVDGDALINHPWRNGTVYLLPRRTFVQQSAAFHGSHLVQAQQWASQVPVQPLARLSVTPEDFPFLARIQPHDPALVRDRAARRPYGFPWLYEDDPGEV